MQAFKMQPSTEKLGDLCQQAGLAGLTIQLLIDLILCIVYQGHPLVWKPITVQNIPTGENASNFAEMRP